MNYEPNDESEDWLRRELEDSSDFELDDRLHLKSQITLDFYNKAPEYSFGSLARCQVDICIGDIPYSLEVVGESELGVVIDLMDEEADVVRYVVAGSVTFPVPASELPSDIMQGMSSSFDFVDPGKYIIFNDEDYPSVVTNNGICKDTHLKLHQVYTIEEVSELVSTAEDFVLKGAMLNMLAVNGEASQVFVAQDGFLTIDVVSYVRLRGEGGSEASFGTKPTFSSLG